MVLNRSAFEIQKQRTKNFQDPNYGYGVIHENVPKLCNCNKRRNFRTFYSLCRATIGINYWVGGRDR